MRKTPRSLLSTPGLSLAALLVAALGIGASSAVFSAANAALFRPLPYDPDGRLLAVASFTRLASVPLPVSVPIYAALARDADTSGTPFSRVAALAQGNQSLDSGERVESVRVARVTTSFWEISRAQAKLGRTFTAGDLASPAQGPPQRVAVLSYGLWKRRYARDPAVLGRFVLLDGEPHRVVGILAEGSPSALSAEVWTPLTFSAQDVSPARSRYAAVSVFARLADGVDPARADAYLSTLDDGEGALHPRTLPLRELFFGSLRPTLTVLLAASAALLLLAAAEMASLLLARAGARQKELAIRLALGAPRGMLARGIVLEGLCLGLAASGPGLLFALWAVELLIPASAPALRAAQVAVDGRVVGFAIAAGLFCGLLASLPAAQQGTRPSLERALRRAGRLRLPGRRTLRQALVVVEVAIALALSLQAATALRTHRARMKRGPGFDTRGALTLRLSLPSSRYPDGSAQADFYQRLMARVAALPGVASTGVLQPLPLAPGTLWSYEIEGPGGRGRGHVTVHQLLVGGAALKTLQLRPVEGRLLGPQDCPRSMRVAMVNRAFSARYWPGESALGKRVRPDALDYVSPFGRRFSPAPLDTDDGWFTVVGVAPDLDVERLGSPPRPQLILPLPQFPQPEAGLLVRQTGDGDPLELRGQLERALSSIDPDLAASEVQTLEELVENSVAAERDAASLLVSLAGIALLFAGTGIFGATSAVLAERERELGLRTLLGARPGALILSLLRQGLALAVAGIFIGSCATMVLAFSQGRPAVPAWGPWLLAAGPLLGAALVATSVPALRAVRIDPGVVLRPE